MLEEEELAHREWTLTKCPLKLIVGSCPTSLQDSQFIKLNFLEVLLQTESCDAFLFLRHKLWITSHQREQPSQNSFYFPPPPNQPTQPNQPAKAPPHKEGEEEEEENKFHISIKTVNGPRNFALGRKAGRLAVSSFFFSLHEGEGGKCILRIWKGRKEKTALVVCWGERETLLMVHKSS